MVAREMRLFEIIEQRKITPVVVVAKCVFFLTSLLKEGKTKLEGVGKRGNPRRPRLKFVGLTSTIRWLDLYKVTADGPSAGGGEEVEVSRPRYGVKTGM